MKKPRIIADQKIPYLKGILEPYANLAYYPGAAITPKEAQNADALLIRTRTKCTQKLLKNTPLTFIASATIGYDHIDTTYCDSHNIGWSNAPGCNAASVEQYIVAALLELAQEFSFDMSSKTIGIIGVGHVGSRIAKVAKAFEMKVLLNDPPRERNEQSDIFLSLEQLQKQADIISLHVPLSKEGPDKTLHLIDSAFLKKTKQNLILINSSRGEIIEEEALKKAIEQKKLLASVLDVWQKEPQIDLDLLSKVSIATPHIAGYSADGKAKGTEMSVLAIAQKFSFPFGKDFRVLPPNPANPHIEIDCAGKTDLEVIQEAYRKTYNIRQDDTDLRKHPENFEALRENYRLRREAKAYRLTLKNNQSEQLITILKILGFELT